MKADLKAVVQEYGGSLTIVISVINSADGTPVPDLAEKNFSIMAVQTPSSWAPNAPASDVWKVKSGLYTPTEGVYVFMVGPPGNKKLAAGPYTIVISLAGFKGWTPLKGQALASGKIGT